MLPPQQAVPLPLRRAKVPQRLLLLTAIAAAATSLSAEYVSTPFVGLRVGTKAPRLVTHLRQGRSSRTTALATANPYDLIGTPRGAPKTEVRKAFRKLTIAKHPDVNPENPFAAKEFQELVNAYNAIMGDEISTSLLNELREEAIKRKEESLKKELQAGQIGIYVYRFFELCVGFILLWATTQSAETLDQLGILPKRCDAQGRCYSFTVVDGKLTPTGDLRPKQLPDSS